MCAEIVKYSQSCVDCAVGKCVKYNCKRVGYDGYLEILYL